MGSVHVLGESYQIGDANPDLVAALERLLERAKSGDIVSIACAVMHNDKSAAYKCVGVTSYSLLGALRLAENVVIESFD